MFSISAILLYILFFVIGWLIARWWWSKQQAESAVSGTGASAAKPASGSAAGVQSRTAPAKPVDTTPPAARVEPDETMAADTPAAGTVTPREEAAPPATPAAKPVAATDPDKPERLDGPRDGKADDLKRISGIGPSNEKKLNTFGVYHFDQIANWTTAQAEWIGKELSFPGRIEREDWIEQAKVLASGGDTEFSKRADKG